jgi:hypothetical protein
LFSTEVPFSSVSAPLHLLRPDVLTTWRAYADKRLCMRGVVQWWRRWARMSIATASAIHRALHHWADSLRRRSLHAWQRFVVLHRQARELRQWRQQQLDLMPMPPVDFASPTSRAQQQGVSHPLGAATLPSTRLLSVAPQDGGRDSGDGADWRSQGERRGVGGALPQLHHPHQDCTVDSDVGCDSLLGSLSDASGVPLDLGLLTSVNPFSGANGHHPLPPPSLHPDPAADYPSLPQLDTHSVTTSAGSCSSLDGGNSQARSEPSRSLVTRLPPPRPIPSWLWDSPVGVSNRESCLQLAARCLFTSTAAAM